MNFLSPLKRIGFMRSVRGHYFQKSLVLVLLITSIPTAMIAIGNYHIGMERIQTEVYRKNESQLHQVFQRLDEQFSQLELLVDKWAANPLFDDKLRDTDLKTEVSTMHNIYSSLSILQSTSPMISRIDLFMENQQLLASNDKGAFRLQEHTDRMAEYQSLLDQPDVIFWQERPDGSSFESASFPLVLVHKLPLASTRPPYGALIVYLNKQRIDKEIAQQSPYDKGLSFLIDSNGDWITSGNSELNDEQQLKELIKSNVMQRKGTSESFTAEWMGTKYSVAYARFSHTGWVYVIATPLSQLSTPITLTSKLMLGVSILGILVSMLLSWFASRRIYRPIQQLVQMFSESLGNKTPEEDAADEIQYIENKWLNVTRESRMIQSLLEDNQVNMKKAFLLQLVQGHLYFFTESELRERMDDYGWDTENKAFALLLVQFSPFSVMGKRFVEGDEQLITFAAANIIEELSREKPELEIINLHNLSVSILVSIPPDKPESQVRNEMFAFASELIDIITKLLGIHVSVGVSKIVDEVKSLPKALDEVRQCLHFRNVEVQGQILSADDLIPHYKEGLGYSFEIEKQLIQAVRMGAEQEACQRLQEFIDSLKHNTGQVFLIQHHMAQLLSSIIHAMMEFGIPHDSLHKGINLYEQLFRLTKTDEINRWFKTVVIQPYIKTLFEKQDIEAKQTIRQVIELIHQEYMKDISLEYLSDRAGMLPKRLSVVFAQVTGKNFIDYVTELRLQKSKELLRSTDLKVNDIAMRVGYQPSYFSKIFKKAEGKTPREYRELDFKL